MAENKTQPTNASVQDFLEAIPDEKRRADALALDQICREITGEKPTLWGTNIVGYGIWPYKYTSGREGLWFFVGFSPRKANMTLYLSRGFETMDDLIEKVGKHTKGLSCFHFRRLENLDEPTLRAMIQRAWTAQ